jgi:hypothetical protein
VTGKGNPAARLTWDGRRGTPALSNVWKGAVVDLRKSMGRLFQTMLDPRRLEADHVLRRRLRESGAQGQATVREVIDGRAQVHELREGYRHLFLLSLDVRGDDGTTFEARGAEFLLFLDDKPWVGRIVPVLYDPADHRRILLDESLDARKAAARANDGNLPEGLSRGRVNEEYFLGHGDELAEQSRALRARVKALNEGMPRLDPAQLLQSLVDAHARGELTDEQFAVARQRALDEI